MRFLLASAMAAMLLPVGMANGDRDNGRHRDDDRGGYSDYHKDRFDPGRVEREGWVLLGSQVVEFKRDTDRIAVRSGEEFRRVRVVVVGGPIELIRMSVCFRDGKKECFRPKLAHVYGEGSRTPAIDLPGRERKIRSVNFVYRSLDRDEGKATVYVFAK